MLPSLHKLIYASDLGDNAPKVFAYAVALAQRHGAEIVFVHAMEPLGPTGRSLVRNIVPQERLKQLESEGLARVRDDIKKRIDRFCEVELGGADGVRGMVSEIHIVEGHPAEVIVAQAKDSGADLIIVGSHGRKALHRTLLGSVVQKVVAHAECPVFLVPIADDVR